MGYSKKNRVDADAIATLAKEMKNKLIQMNSGIDDVKDKLDEFGRGDGDIAYWSGEQAQDWFGKAYKNLANSYLRVAKTCDAMRVTLKYAYDSYTKDKNTSTKKATLSNLKGQYDSLYSQAMSAAKKIEGK
ncbi:MAG: hypothetical protein IJH34_10190 [Romboutsia sp.]|nr:hypothetical protein [Romboutsia sp.]